MITNLESWGWQTFADHIRAKAVEAINLSWTLDAALRKVRLDDNGMCDDESLLQAQRALHAAGFYAMKRTEYPSPKRRASRP